MIRTRLTNYVFHAAFIYHCRQTECRRYPPTKNNQKTCLIYLWYLLSLVENVTDCTDFSNPNMTGEVLLTGGANMEFTSNNRKFGKPMKPAFQHPYFARNPCNGFPLQSLVFMAISLGILRSFMTNHLNDVCQVLCRPIGQFLSFDIFLLFNTRAYKYIIENQCYSVGV